MEFIQAILLGIIQGITEFLPVSSSGHLVLLPRFFAWQDQGLTFDALLHGATLLALVVVFWKDIVSLVFSIFPKNVIPEFAKGKYQGSRKLAIWIILASIPAAFGGMLLGEYVDAARLPEVVGFNLIFWGIVMWLADRYRTKNKTTIKKPEKMRWHHALFIGFAQALALIPGTSRSGITLTAGLFAGMGREQALRFSFLMGIPVFFGATLLKANDAFQNGLSMSIPALAVGFVVAFITGIVAIRFLLKYVAKNNLSPFVGYRIILGILVLVLL